MATQADLSRLDAILKDRELRDSIEDAVNRATPFMDRINQRLELSGRKGIFPVQFGVNEGIYAREDKGAFGDSQVNKPELAEVTAKYIYALFEISGPTMSATRDQPGAFEDALGLQLQNTIDGVKLELGRQIIGDGSGTLALIQSVTDTDTIVVDSPFGLDRYKSNRDVRNIIRADMPLDVVDAGDGTTEHGDNLAVATISHSGSGSTIDFTTTDASLTTAADGDYVVRNDNRNLELEGFLSAVDDTGSYLNITRSGLDGWQGVLVDAAGGGASAVPLEQDHLRDTIDEIMEVTGKEPGFIVCNFKQRRNIYNLLAPQIRFQPMNTPAGLNENTVTFDGMPVVVERFFPPEHIGIVNPDFWYHTIDRDTEWISGLNGTVLHFHRTSDVFTAVLATYRNMACLYPATNGIIYGLEE